jgi:hypothetical protein
MRIRFTENRNFPIRSDHCRGMTKDSFEIFLADGVENALTAALFDDPERGFRGVRDGRIHSTQASDISQRLARQ